MTVTACVSVLMLCGLAVGQQKKPERTVQGSSVISRRDPAMRIVLPSAARYVGADRWDLYDLADCELHVFVEADAAKRIHSFYWIQFEQYLPSRPEMHHDYKDEVRSIGGVNTYVRARFGRGDEPAKPGSDLEHVRKLLAAAGLREPDEMMNVRLVRMLDAEQRKELMVIYAEDLAPTGAKAADLMPGGGASKRWLEMQQELIARAEGKIRFEASPER